MEELPRGGEVREGEERGGRRGLGRVLRPEGLLEASGALFGESDALFGVSDALFGASDALLEEAAEAHGRKIWCFPCAYSLILS